MFFMLCNFLMSYSSASSRMSSSPSLDLQSSGSEYLPDPETKRRGRRRRSPFELTSEESLDTAAPPECQTLPERRKRKRTKFGCSLCPAVVINLLRHLREVHEVGCKKMSPPKQDTSTGYAPWLIAGDTWPASKSTLRASTTSGTKTLNGISCRRTL